MLSAVDDTSPEAERRLGEILRRMTPAEKWQQIWAMYRMAKVFHAAGVRLRSPDATAEQIHEAWLEVTLDKPLVQTLKEVQRGSGR